MDITLFLLCISSVHQNPRYLSFFKIGCTLDIFIFVSSHILQNSYFPFLNWMYLYLSDIHLFFLHWIYWISLLLYLFIFCFSLLIEIIYISLSLFCIRFFFSKSGIPAFFFKQDMLIHVVKIVICKNID